VDQHIILLFGGLSREWMVSVASAQSLVRYLKNPTCWFWSPKGYVHEVTKDQLLAHENPFNTPFEPQGAASFSSMELALDSEIARHAIFVLGLHGTTSEDGILQGWFEKRGLAFTGSSAAASALAFDKVKSKEILKKEGVLVPDEVVISAKERAHSSQILSKFLAKNPKAILKPIADGSSVGLVILEDHSGISSAQRELEKNPSVDYLVENLIDGEELTVGVIETPQGLKALPCTQIVKDKGRHFDYEGKYLGAGIKEVTPANVAPELVTAAQEVALVAHRALGCRGYSRTDVIMSPQGPVFLEINTLPGLTKASLVPQQLEAAGISFQDFVDNQIRIARTSPERG